MTRIPETPRCGVCGSEAYTEYNGLHLCHEDWAVACRLEALTAAQTDSSVKPIGYLSRGPRDDHEGGHKRPFSVVPDDSLEQVRRDVTVTFDEVPFWAVEHLFHRVHTELGKPDLDGWAAKLVINYSLLDETEYARLLELRDLFWMDFEIDVTKTRLYPPYREVATQ